MHDQAQMAYWQKTVKFIQNYNSLPCYIYLHDAIGTVFNEDDGTWDKGMVKVYDNFANDFLYPNINSIMVFAENHDTNRINHVYQKNDFRKYQMTMVY
jgi:hypothetical protein